MAVPLIIQSFFIALLLTELNRVEVDTRREMLAREYVSKVDQLLVDAYKATGALFRLSYEESTRDDEAFRKNLKKSESNLDEIRVLSRRLYGSNDRQFNENIQEIRSIIKKLRIIRGNQLKIMARREIRPQDNLMGFMFVDNFLRAAGELAELEHARLDQELGRSQASRDTVKTLVYYGLVANVIAAFVIAIFFARNIESKINKLLANIDHFSKKEDLIPPHKVDDELSQVDKTFYEMASELKEAQIVKQNFIAMIGHDIRSPLTSIRGVFDLLKDEKSISEDPDIEDLVEGGYGETGRLISLTSNLLDVQALESGHFSINTASEDLFKVVEQSILSLKSISKGKKVSIVNQVSENLEAFIDRNRIIQVLINLLANAINHSPENSQIVISSRLEENFVILEVADMGRGVDEKEKQTVFEAYSHSKDSHSMSLGLGLAICRAIVEAHGGEIGVKGNKPSGAIFYFSLPADQSDRMN